MSDLLQRIRLVPFPESQYMKEDTQKKQIYVHHTAGNPDPFGVVRWWESNEERIATSFVIAGKPTSATSNWKDGDIIQAFSSKHWAWHLGLKQSHIAAGGRGALTNTQLNKMSIGLEICNWGQLTKTPNGFVSYTKAKVPDNEVVELATPFRGFKYYHKYTNAQLDSTRDLLRYFGTKWNIPLAYKGDKIFNVCPEALRGEPGVWSHTSVRPDKNDVFPQPELIQMLKSL